MVKILRSPHANAMVEEIETAGALKIPGVVAIYTWKDVPQNRYTNAGQTYPEPSPYDRLILDRHVRFAGDAVAIIAAETEKAALRAMKVIKVKYQVLEAVLDPHTAKDNPVLVHPEEDWYPPCPVGGDNHRNLVASETNSDGDIEAVLNSCDIVLDRTRYLRVQSGHDGDFPHLCRDGRLRAAPHCVLHPDRLPRPPDSFPGTGNPQEPHPGGKAPDRRRLRRQTDLGL